MRFPKVLQFFVSLSKSTLLGLGIHLFRRRLTSRSTVIITRPLAIRCVRCFPTESVSK